MTTHTPRLTPLQEAIEKINFVIKGYNPESEFGNGTRGGYEKAVILLESLLPAEKKLIEQTWDAGFARKRFEDTKHESAYDYFISQVPDKETFLNQFKPEI